MSMSRGSATLADRIRGFVLENYVHPASHERGNEIRVRAGDVHKGMRLANRMPAVCAALDSTILLRQGALELRDRSGPPQGATAEWTFRSVGRLSTPANPDRSDGPLSEPTYRRTPMALADRDQLVPQRFTLRGRMFEKTRQDFIRAVADQRPGRIQKYSVAINEIPYPIRQVVSCGTGMPPIAITSQEAFRILDKLGFDIDTGDGA